MALSAPRYRMAESMGCPCGAFSPADQKIVSEDTNRVMAKRAFGGLNSSLCYTVPIDLPGACDAPVQYMCFYTRPGRICLPEHVLHLSGFVY